MTYLLYQILASSRERLIQNKWKFAEYPSNKKRKKNNVTSNTANEPENNEESGPSSTLNDENEQENNQESGPSSTSSESPDLVVEMGINVDAEDVEEVGVQLDTDMESYSMTYNTEETSNNSERTQTSIAPSTQSLSSQVGMFLPEFPICKKTQSKCFICNSKEGRKRVPQEARKQVYY